MTLFPVLDLSSDNFVQEPLLDNAIKQARLHRTLAESRSASAASDQIRILADEALRTERHIVAGDSHNNTLWMYGDVNMDKTRMIIADLNARHRIDPTADLTLYVCSEGGDIIAGLALYDQLKALQAAGHHLTTIATGMCASMGVPIWCAGDVRLMGDNCTFLLHQPSLGSEGTLGELYDTVELAEQLYSQILDILASTSEKSARSLRALIKRKDLWLSAKDMAEYGFGQLLSEGLPL
jgi:ATP-dependent Clp protease protease subunit